MSIGAGGEFPAEVRWWDHSHLLSLLLMVGSTASKEGHFEENVTAFPPVEISWMI